MKLVLPALFWMVLLSSPGYSQSTGQTGGWKLTDYAFVDGSSAVDNVVAGTTSKINDVDRFTGSKGNIEIAKNRWDQKTGALLAGVTYSVRWTDPPEALFPGDQIRMHYQLKIVTAKAWAPDHQSVNFSQGMGGVFLLNGKGENYFKSDFASELVSAKAVTAGSRNKEERTLTANFGAGYKAIYTYTYDVNMSRGSDTPATVAASPTSIATQTGWQLASYEFVDGSSNVQRVIAGTNSRVNDVDQFSGTKGKIEITSNRWDQKTGGLLAGVTYRVQWTDPPAVLLPGDQIRMQYELRTVTAKAWTPPDQSVVFNQGLGGVFLLNAKGENYFKSDFKSDLLSAKTVAKGTRPNEEKTITANFGAGFLAVYTYRWREH